MTASVTTLPSAPQGLSPMRVALLGPANSIHLQRWARALVERGHAVCVLSQQPCPPQLLPAAVERVELPHHGGLGYLSNAGALRRHLAEWQADLLNVHYASGPGTTATLARLTLPVLLSVWGSDVYEFPERSPLHAAWLRRVLRGATAIASTSHAMAVRVKELTPEREQVAITPFGVDVDRFTPLCAGDDPLPACANDTPPPRITIGLFKTLAPVYGVDVLLRAFAGLVQAPGVGSRCDLLIVGDGPQRSELEALADRLGIGPRTRFVGAVPHADAPAWLRRFDIFVAPSRSESFGVAVLEASACGVPVVVSDAGGLPEVAQDGHTGLVVPRENVAALQQALATLAGEATLRATYGRQGRAFVVRAFAWASCVDRMEACYRQLLSQRTVPADRSTKDLSA